MFHDGSDGGIPTGQIVRFWVRSVLLLLAVVLVDWVTPPELGFSAFYVLPVLVLAWTLGTRQGIIMALFAGVAWYLADRFNGRPLLHESFRIWDALNHSFSYVLVAWAVGALKNALAAQQSLSKNLQSALAEVKELRGLLRTCAWCHKIKGDDDQWQPVEAYIREKTRATFTHGICPDCAAILIAESKRD
jgi:hypothetical protein